MRLPNRSPSFRNAVLTVLILAMPAGATDLSQLKKGQVVRLFTSSGARLCEGKMSDRTRNEIHLVLSQTTPDCGARRALLTIPASRVLDAVPERRSTKKRFWWKAAAAAGAVGALALIPLTSSDPESLIALANPLFPTIAAFGGWHAVPARRGFLLVVSCAETGPCFPGP